VLGDVVDAVADVGLGGAALAPDLGQSRGDAAKVDVEDELLVREVAVNVAVLVLEVDRGHAPRGRVGAVGVDVLGDAAPFPGEQLDVVTGPLHGIDTAVLGGPGPVGLGSNTTLVVVLERGVGKGVVTVVRQDGRALFLAVEDALAILGGVAGVKGWLVPRRVVPLLVKVNLAIVGPVLTVCPAVVRVSI
jgi:hypothetical protein